MNEIWEVAYNDNYDDYVGSTALFSTEERAREFYEKQKAEFKSWFEKNYHDKVYGNKIYYREDNDYCEGYKDKELSEVVFNLGVFPRRLDTCEWESNYDW